jgi:hypothetical protein
LLQNAGKVISSSSYACLDEEMQTAALKDCSQILHSIFASEGRIPILLQFVCSIIYHAVASKFSPEQAIQIVGGFFFLRFICPALIAPHLHGVTDCMIDHHTLNPQYGNTEGIIVILTCGLLYSSNT